MPAKSVLHMKNPQITGIGTEEMRGGTGGKQGGNRENKREFGKKSGDFAVEKYVQITRPYQLMAG